MHTTTNLHLFRMLYKLIMLDSALLIKVNKLEMKTGRSSSRGLSLSSLIF